MDALLPPAVANKLVKHWLTETRKRSGLSQRAAAEHLGLRTQSSIAQIEGDDPSRLPTNAHLVELLRLYRRPDLIDQMVELLHVARQYQHQPHQPVVLADFELLVGLEAFGSRVQSWSSLIISGVLQTEAYALAVITASAVQQPQLDLELLLHVRALRRSFLTRESNPLAGQFWTEERVLRRPIGGTQVHAQQLATLLELDELPNVEFRVIPEHMAAHPGVGGSFAVIHDRNGGRVAYEETRQQAHYYGAPTQLREYENALAAFEPIALSPKDSRALIQKILKEETK